MIRRIFLVASNEAKNNFRRPLFWVCVAVLGLAYVGISTGTLQVQTSGGSTVGGAKQWVTSEFAFAQSVASTQMLVYSFFVAVMAGMAVIRDDDVRIGALLHCGPLTASEYVWAKFIGCLISVYTISIMHICFAAIAYHLLPSEVQNEIVGPFQIRNYLVPMILIGWPTMTVFAGISFAVGEWTRKPLLIFALPLVFILVFGLFFNSWSPIWLPGWANRLLMMLDPYGSRWLSETWLKQDRGVEFYNHQPIVFDWMYLLSRCAMVLIGLSFVGGTVLHFGRRLRGVQHGDLDSLQDSSLTKTTRKEYKLFGERFPEMSSGPIGLLANILTVTRFEFRLLLRSPGFYLFAPFIILQALLQSRLEEGPFSTPVLYTSGTLAAGALNTLTLLGCALILFYTVEAQLRESISRLSSIVYSSRCSTFALLMGKSLANAAIVALIVVAMLLASIAVLYSQGEVGIELSPFLLIWGGLLLPTFFVWSALVTMVVTATRSRYLTYAISSALFFLTFYLFLANEMSWLTNWLLWDVVTWSDISRLEFDRYALLLNRLLIVVMAVVFLILATSVHRRIEGDYSRMFAKANWGISPRSWLKIIAVVAPPALLISLLWSTIDSGTGSEKVEREQKDYWRQNVATWQDMPNPSPDSVLIEIDFQPSQYQFSVAGKYVLRNDTGQPLSRFAMTGGNHWRDVQWTLNDERFDPEDRSNLFVFQLPEKLQPGASVDLGFKFWARFPDGVSKAGNAGSEFVMPSSIVLTSFWASFCPLVGFSDEIGIDEENRSESRQYTDDFFEETLKPFIGWGKRFDVKMVITGPQEFTFNSVGIKRSDVVQNGMRTVVWETDHPVSFFNVVGGRWAKKEGQHSTVFYDANHDFNVREISETLDAARVYYSRWFAPYPWKELRINEFASLATYGHGFPTNITFSEGIGFLTRDTPGLDAPFLVTAHETAHQWWGNILVAGKGPGGNVLVEGTAHFSTGLLFEEVKGVRARIEFFEFLEKSYLEDRVVDAERPLVLFDGSRDGDRTLTYDKGGWVFWMLMQHMGRQNCLDGIRAFFKKYQDNDDHPVLQDFLEVMRRFSKDEDAFDNFVRQWFFEVVLPDYEILELKRASTENGKWNVTGIIKNSGTGSMPVDIAISKGERFEGQNLGADFQEQRIATSVGAGQQVEFSITSSFQPNRIVIDPDALVLQKNRKNGARRF